ncbi:MAG: hypothetical protein ACK2UP_01725 [Candidatus Promineifilaceae bacterium]|jgi:hypothetical protein
MHNRNTFTKALAIGGTVLVWIPLLAPLFFGVLSWILDGIFRVDYLMPAELFALVLGGGVLLLWAARRAGILFGFFAWGLGIAVLALFSSQLTAEVTGLASGETAIGGWQWALVMGLLVVYIVAVAVIAIGGLQLLRHLFQAPLPHAQ